jgi:Spy/CpxP family protein refolding chaperone
MKIRSILLSGLAVAMAGLVSAQPVPRPRFGPGNGGPGNFGHGGNLEQRLTRQLGLNAEQQNKVHTILAESRIASQDVPQKMQALHASLTEAVKAGDEAQIEKISQDLSQLHQQQMAAHAKNIAKIYATLTPDQKVKVGPNLEMLMGGPNPRMRNGGAGGKPPVSGVVQ